MECRLDAGGCSQSFVQCCADWKRFKRCLQHQLHSKTGILHNRGRKYLCLRASNRNRSHGNHIKRTTHTAIKKISPIKQSDDFRSIHQWTADRKTRNNDAAKRNNPITYLERYRRNHAVRDDYLCDPLFSLSSRLSLCTEAAPPLYFACCTKELFWFLPHGGLCQTRITQLVHRILWENDATQTRRRKKLYSI